jgi:hypothetical protein
VDAHLSKEVLEGLRRAGAQALRKKNRLRVHMGKEIYPVLRCWEGGFTLGLENAPHLRGSVDLYDGAKHLYQCLIICAASEGDEMVYEYKRQTAAVDRPPVDFVLDETAPIALLT